LEFLPSDGSSFVNELNIFSLEAEGQNRSWVIGQCGWGFCTLLWPVSSPRWPEHRGNESLCMTLFP
jgi:hypothetical protein